MATNAQRVQLGPFFFGGLLQGGAKLYHYEAGLSNDKDIWSDRTKITTLAQPFVSDAAGIFNFFADGLYKLVIVRPESTGPADLVLYTLDNWEMSDPATDALFTKGDAIPSASLLTVGPEVWHHVTGSTTITGLSGTIPFCWLVFDGSLTLQHSGSLILPTGQNKQTASGDVAFFLNEGSSVWRLAGYVENDGLVVAAKDSRTNTVDAPLVVRSLTSATPANGLGVGMKFEGQSADESPSDFGQLEFVGDDVSAGGEDTGLYVRLRVAGAALSRAWAFFAGSAFRAGFTHSLTADRLYTWPDAAGGIVVLHNAAQTLTNKTIDGNSNTITNIGTGALKTATGGASTVSVSPADVTMNDYAFFPSITSQYSNAVASGAVPIPGLADPGDTVGRVRVYPWDNGAGSYEAVIRWRYLTASDNPVIWLAYDPATGKVWATWASDDPTPNDEPGVRVPGLLSVKLTAFDLEHLSVLNTKAAEAGDLIRDRKLKSQHLAYRALQLVANDPAPSKWLLDNLSVDTVTKGVKMVAT